MRSFIAQLVLSFAIATSATEQCDPVSDVVQVLQAVPYAPELCSTLLQISTTTATSIAIETIIETRSIETTETSTETETITETETTVTGTTTSTADAVSVTETETIKIQACRPTITIKKRNTALETASASETCTKNKSASAAKASPTQPTSAVKTSTTSTSTTTCSSSTSGSYKAMSSYPAVSSTFEYRYEVTSSVVQPYHAVTSSIIQQYPAVTSSIIQQYPAVNSSTYQPYPTVDSTSTITSSVEISTPTPLVLCAEVPAELQRFECARITQGCDCLSLETPMITQIVYSSVTVVEQSITTSMAHITTTATVTSTQLIDATEQYTPTTTIVATVTETAPGPDFNNDPNNCGACGIVCPNDGICSLGKCANRNPTPTQAVVNPGFEDATTAPWILFPGGYQIVNTGDPQYGLKTPRVQRTAGLFASIRQVPTIIPGAYLVQFSIKVEGPDPSRCLIYLTGIAEYAYGPAANSDWNTYAYSYTSAGSNNEFIRIVVSCGSTPQSGYVYFDNITVKPMS